jgi:hypothetical protein
VGWRPDVGKWQAQFVTREGAKKYLGLFDDEESAARTYNEGVLAAGARCRCNPIDAEGNLVAKPASSSQYFGVTFKQRKHRNHVLTPEGYVDRSQAWEARVTASRRFGLDGKQKFLGLYDTEVRAAEVVDEFLREFLPALAPRKVNFPTDVELAICSTDHPVHS